MDQTTDEALAAYRLEGRAILLFCAYNDQGPNPWKTWDGNDVPRWEALSEQVKEKWRAVARTPAPEAPFVPSTPIVPGQAPSLMRPSIGRVVHFNVDPDIYAGIIVRVLDSPENAVDLVTFGPSSIYHNHSVPFAPFPAAGHWTWPARV